jgi:hypothetical protein
MANIQTYGALRYKVNGGSFINATNPITLTLSNLTSPLTSIEFFQYFDTNYTEVLSSIRLDVINDGPKGPGIVYRGEYNPDATYFFSEDRRDVVVFGGIYYAVKDLGSISEEEPSTLNQDY